MSALGLAGSTLRDAFFSTTSHSCIINSVHVWNNVYERPDFELQLGQAKFRKTELRRFRGYTPPSRPEAKWDTTATN
jgi:hypothetical protein